MGKYEEIAIKDLEVSEFNVRKSIGDFTELLNSVEEVGVLEPLVVRPKGKRYEVVIGRRRLTAAKAAGLKRVPVVVREMSDAGAVIASAVENVQRGDLEPEEEYDAYKRLMELDPERYGTHRKIAKAIGKSHDHINRVFSTVELLRGIRMPAKYAPSMKERKVGKAIPQKHAYMVAQAFKHEDVRPAIKKLPPTKVKQKKKELIETVAPLDEFEARKVVNHFKMEPERPIPEIKQRALARETGVHIHIYLPPKVGKALEKASEKRHMSMEELIPIAVEEWLKQVGYL